MAALPFSSSVACQNPCRRLHFFSLRPKKPAVSFLSSSSSAAATDAFVFRCKGGNHSIFPEEKENNSETQPEHPSSPESPKQETAAAAFARAIRDERGKKNTTERKLPSLPDLTKNVGEWGIEAGASAAAAIIDELGKKSAPESEHPPQPGSSKDNHSRFPEERGDNSETQPEPPSSPESPKQETVAAAFAGAISDEWGKKNATERKLPSLPDLTENDGEWGIEAGASAAAAIIDELGKNSAPESEHPSQPGSPKANNKRGAGSDAIFPKAIIGELGKKAIPEIEALSQAGLHKVEVELGREGPLSGIGTPALLDDKLGALKRRLVDSLDGTELGLRTSVEARAEILELVTQLEAENPTPKPTESPKLDGNWILLYTVSELSPLLAVGATPLFKIRRISQTIESKTKTIVNTTTFSSLLATLSFSAYAVFEVRSSSIFKVQFNEGSFHPPEIQTTQDIAEKVDILGQKIDLKSIQWAVNPIQETAANIIRSISSHLSLRFPFPGRTAESWLLITYLDKDFRISRSDIGLWVLVKEGSPLLKNRVHSLISSLTELW